MRAAPPPAVMAAAGRVDNVVFLESVAIGRWYSDTLQENDVIMATFHSGPWSSRA
jgi:hypothetical protein